MPALFDIGTGFTPRIFRGLTIANLVATGGGGGGGGGADPYGENVSLLLHMNGANGSTTFTDSSLNNFTITRFGNAQISTTQSKYGGAAGYFDGSGDYLSLTPTNAFNFYNTNYTIEMWVYRTASQSGGALISTRNAGVYSNWELQVNSNNTIGLLVQNAAGFWYTPFGVAPIVGNTTIQQNTWTHVAWVCNGSNTTVYVNGVADSGLTNLNIPILQAFAQPLNIYIGSGGDGFFNGYIDDLRITKGVARYTSNFTPPQAQLPDPAPSVPTSGLQLRLKADAGVTTSGPTVTAWADQSGNATVSAFGSPLLASNQLNGRPAILFNGSNSYFTANLASPIAANTPRTYVVIGKYNNPSSTPQQGYLNSIGFESYVFKNSNESRSYFYTGADQIAGRTPFNLANYHITTVVHNGVPGSNFIQIDGVKSTTISYGNMIALPQITQFVVGGRGPGSEILNGAIVELLVYGRELATQEITTLENYFYGSL